MGDIGELSKYVILYYTISVQMECLYMVAKNVVNNKRMSLTLGNKYTVLFN